MLRCCVLYQHFTPFDYDAKCETYIDVNAPRNQRFVISTQPDMLPKWT